MAKKSMSAAEFLQGEESAADAVAEGTVEVVAVAGKKQKVAYKKAPTSAAAQVDLEEAIEESKPEKPTTKAAVLALSEEEIETLVAAHNMALPKWLGLDFAEKQKALIKFLGIEGKATTSASAKKAALNDPIAAVSKDIEELKDQAEVEQEINTLLESEGVNDFKLGGLLQKLSEVGAFDEATSFKHYVEEKFGVKYRKARYLIANYNGLIAAGISWGDVSGLGWTKLKIILPALTADNVKDWVAKAQNLNVPSLQQAVKAALAKDTHDAPTVDEGNKLSTKTFKLAEDQLEVVNDAIEDAQKKSGTDHAGVALEYVCTEYLANTTPNKAAEDLIEIKKKLAALEAEAKGKDQQIKELEADNEALQEAVGEGNDGGAKSLSLTEFYKAAIARHDGDKFKTVEWLLGPEFDELFPMVTDFTIETEEAAA